MRRSSTFSSRSSFSRQSDRGLELSESYDDMRKGPAEDVEQKINLEALQKMRELFLKADADRSGGLDLDEFCSQFSGIFEEEDPLELRRLFMKIDADSNGQVDWDEFCNFVFLDKDNDENHGPEEKWMLDTHYKFIKGLPGGHLGGHDVVMVHNPDDRMVAPDAILENIGIAQQHVSLPQIEEHSDTVIGLCIWHPGDRVYTSGMDGKLKVWEGKKMQLLETHRVGKNLVGVCLAVMPLSRKLFASLSDRTISIYSVSRSSTALVGRLTQLHAVATCMMVNVTKNEDEEMVFWGTTEGAIDFYCPSSKTLFRDQRTNASGKPDILVIPKKDLSRATVEGWNNFHAYHEGAEVTQIMWDSASSSMISSDSLSRIEFVDLNMYRRRVFDHPIRFHKKGISSFAVSKEYSHLFTAGLERDVNVCNLVTGAAVGKLTGPSASIRQLLVIDECNQLMALDNRKTITIWDLRTRLIIQCVEHQMNFYPVNRIELMAYDYTNRRLLACSAEVLVYQNEVEFLGERGHEAPIVRVLFAETFSLLISADAFGFVITWDVTTGAKKFRFKVPDAPITAMALDANERRVLIGTGTGKVNLWNFNNGSHLRSCHYPGPKIEITGVAYMRLKAINLIMATAWNGDIMLWSDELEKGRSASELHNCRVVKAHPADIQCMTFTGDRNPAEASSGMVITADHEGTIQAWSAVQSSVVATIKAPDYIPPQDRAVTGIILAPIGGMSSSAVEGDPKVQGKSMSSVNNYVIASTLDGFVRVWTYLVAGGTCFAEVRAVPLGFNGKMLETKGSVTAMSSNMAMTVLATGDNRGWVRIWDISGLEEQSSNFKDPATGGQVRVTPEIIEATNKCLKHQRWIMASVNPISSIKVLEHRELVVVGSVGNLHQLTLWTLKGANVGTFGFRGDHGSWIMNDLTTWSDEGGHPKPEMTPLEQYNVRHTDLRRIGSPRNPQLISPEVSPSRSRPRNEGEPLPTSEEEAEDLQLVSDSEEEAEEEEVTLEEVEVAALLQAGNPPGILNPDQQWLSEATTTSKVNMYRIKQFNAAIELAKEQERDEMMGRRIGVSTLIKKKINHVTPVENLASKPVMNRLGLLNRDFVRTASRAIGVDDSYHVDRFIQEGNLRTESAVHDLHVKAQREHEMELKKKGGI